jgi:hypothetical protein
MIIKNIKNDIEIKENYGYIGCIQVEDKKYIFRQTKLNLKQFLNKIYSTPYEYAYDYQKLLKILEKTKYDKINIYILKKNIPIENLDTEFYESLNTYENIEYNVTVMENYTKRLYAMKYIKNKK